MRQPLLGERIAARQWLGVAISFAGVALIGMQGRLLQPSFNVGDLFALASMARRSAPPKPVGGLR